MTNQKDKPPYKVPLMPEIEALPWNGFNVVSTFSGCGGSCLGYRMAGFRVLWASEFIPAAQEVYKLNHPNSILDTRDIRKVQPEEILEAIGMSQGEIDILDGSPPCASFSTAGKREKGWGQVKNYSSTKQRVDDLFFEYARILKGLQPKVFVAENVSGLVKGKAKGYFKIILKELKACGYNVRAKVLDAQWLGVPQMRQRLIFVGVRNDLELSPVFPKPMAYQYSVREALPWIIKQGDNGGFGKGEMREATKASPTIGTGPQAGNGRFPPAVVEVRAYRDKRGAFGNDGDISEQPAPTVLSDSIGTHWIVNEPENTWVDDGHKDPIDKDAPAPAVMSHGRGFNDLQIEVDPEASIEGYAIGEEWDKMDPGSNSEKYLNLKKSPIDKPSYCVSQMGGQNAGVASVTHPTEKRKFYIAELKRICAFPDDFQLTGSYAQQWERLGRAVPPVMMEKIASVIRDEILSEIN